MLVAFGSVCNAVKSDFFTYDDMKQIGLLIREAFTFFEKIVSLHIKRSGVMKEKFLSILKK